MYAIQTSIRPIFLKMTSYIWIVEVISYETIITLISVWSDSLVSNQYISYVWWISLGVVGWSHSNGIYRACWEMDAGSCSLGREAFGARVGWQVERGMFSLKRKERRAGVSCYRGGSWQNSSSSRGEDISVLNGSSFSREVVASGLTGEGAGEEEEEESMIYLYRTR